MQVVQYLHYIMQCPNAKKIECNKYKSLTQHLTAIILQCNLFMNQQLNQIKSNHRDKLEQASQMRQQNTITGQLLFFIFYCFSYLLFAPLFLFYIRLFMVIMGFNYIVLYCIWVLIVTALAMGNILFRQTINQQQIHMQRQQNKSIPLRHNEQPVANRATRSINNRAISQPKNLKKQTVPICSNKRKQPQPLSSNEIMDKLLLIVVQQLQYDQSWQKFVEIAGSIFKFNLIFPVPLNEQGQQLIKNGSFIVYWLKIISRNQYVNMPLIYKHARDHYLPLINKQKQQLELFLKQKDPPQQNKTPLKVTAEPLKRSILKNSEKKVQFGKSQIIYPQLEEYNPIIPKPKLSVAERKANIRKINGFLLDYFQINTIYLLEQVEIIGVLKEFYSTLCIIQVKQKGKNIQSTCIGIINNKGESGSHQTSIFKEIQKEYQNLCYLQLEGKDPSCLWVDGIPSDKQK